MTFFRNDIAREGLRVELALLLILTGGALTASACGSEAEDCSKTQTCITGQEQGGGGGDDGQGGTSGGAVGGSSGSGTSGSSSSGSSGDGAGGDGGSATGGRAGMGGEGEQPGEGGEGGAPEPPDGPTIVSVSPADGEVGVYPDVDLVVTFSEPMNRAATEEAFQSQDIPLAGVVFSWNADSTVLSIDPAGDLDLDEVSDLADVAPNYAASITDGAVAASGTRLAADFEWSFRTVRRVTHTIAVPPENIFNVFNDSSTFGVACRPLGGVNAGDGFAVSTFILISVDITSLPETIILWEAVTLSAQQTEVVGTPFGTSADNLGLLRAYHMNVNPSVDLTFQTPNLGLVGVFSASPELTMRSLDVATSFVEDWTQRTARSQHSQYKLAFDQITDNDGNPDRAIYSCDRITLTARYLTP